MKSKLYLKEVFKVERNWIPAIYKLLNLKVKGFVDVYDATDIDGLYNFNTKEGIENGKRDLLVSADDLIIIMK